MTTRFDAAVVGGGVIGSAVARELSARGRRVVLLERAAPGGEASGVAAGLLSPQADAHGPGPFFDLCLASRRLYPDWAHAIEQESGRSVGLSWAGILRCALSPEQEARLARSAQWQRAAGLAVADADPAEAATAAGLPIGPEVRSALFFPEDGFVDSRRLSVAAAEAAQRRGVDVRSGTPVQGFRIEAGRCLGVETQAGLIRADMTVDAAGAWASFDGALPFPLPVFPVKGQIFALRLPGDPLSTAVESEEVYLVPSREGRVLVGATAEHAGFDKRVTAGAATHLLAAAARLLPAVAEAELLAGRAGLRPGTPDGLPLLGPSPVEGLWLAAGHFRNGILLAPVTARLLADAADGADTSRLAPYLPERFARAETASAERFG